TSIPRFQRLVSLLSIDSWAAGPGYYISRRWRLNADTTWTRILLFVQSGLDWRIEAGLGI
ncbi:MAG TPA: hypothetical protein VNO50_02580, partial [Pyrinomonadaceae bacterium]|nr:hypothetical protein [Pyrinomonadaceae bacterium]